MNQSDFNRLQRTIDELSVISADASKGVVVRGQYLLEKRDAAVIEPVLGRLSGINPEANGAAIAWMLNHASEIRGLLLDYRDSELRIAAALL